MGHCGHFGPAAHFAVNIELVPAPLVDRVWPQISDRVDVACKKTGGDLTSGYLWQECRSGHAFLLIAHEGEEVSGESIWRFETWQSGPKFRCLSGSGIEKDDWFGLMRAKVEEMARMCGASLVYEGRKGWSRHNPKARVIRILYEEAI